MGWIHVSSVRAGPGSAPDTGVDGPSSIGRARRCGLRCMSVHTLVAMRYSHERSEERPSKRWWARHALTMVSCTASSASEAAPSMR